MANTENKNLLVIKRPRITEKSANLATGVSYTFDIATSATKKEVADAIKSIYKVSPRRVNIIKVPKKTVSRRGGRGTTSVGKKAVVYLKSGDKIEFL